MSARQVNEKNAVAYSIQYKTLLYQKQIHAFGPPCFSAGIPKVSFGLLPSIEYMCFISEIYSFDFLH